MKIRDLGLADYAQTVAKMQDFTANRTAETEDELWLVEHAPVFTQGLNGQPSHILSAGDIPVIQTDRGGQVTYHGPGQLVIYALIDLRRLGIGVRQMVTLLEQSVIELLAPLGISAQARSDAPGVYVKDEKIAALGLRVKRGACYHGLSLNIAMDLQPFNQINPCGYPGLVVTDLSSLGVKLSFKQVKEQLTTIVLAQLKK
jgi:lipoyl(octanoyl) transferase